MAPVGGVARCPFVAGRIPCLATRFGLKSTGWLHSLSIGEGEGPAAVPVRRAGRGVPPGQAPSHRAGTRTVAAQASSGAGAWPRTADPTMRGTACNRFIRRTRLTPRCGRHNIEQERAPREVLGCASLFFSTMPFPTRCPTRRPLPLSFHGTTRRSRSSSPVPPHRNWPWPAK